VFEQSWDSSGFFVTCCLQSGNEVVTGNFSGLGESVHAFVDSCIDVSVRFQVLV
jgi:hypothetical protein